MTALIERYLRHAKSGGLSPQTIDDRRKLLYRLDRELPMGLCMATTEELEEFLAGPDDRSWAAETRRTYYTGIASFFAWACDSRNPTLDYDPAAALTRPKAPPGLPRPATEDQLGEALMLLPAPWDAAVALAAYAGARAAEVAALERDQITLQAMTLFGKGGKRRAVGTHPAVWSRIESLPAGPIIVRERHPWRPADGDYVSSRIAVMLGRIGLGDITFHQFRHRFATMALRPRQFGGAGASLRAVQELLGHGTVATTARYTLVSDEERDAAIAALPSYRPTSS